MGALDYVSGLMIDVDGVLVCGRPSDGKPWASTIESDLGFSMDSLQREFFTPYWDEIVIGQAELSRHLKPALAKIAPNLTYEEFIAYWFKNDARLNIGLLEELNRQRKFGKKVYLATNQEHIRATYLLKVLGLGNYCDGIFYSAALGCRKPDTSFFAKASALSGLPPNQLLLVDDTYANIAAAKNSGWNATQWREGSSLSAVMAELGL
jgi:putative hydrolase of the HAD superfamily